MSTQTAQRRRPLTLYGQTLNGAQLAAFGTKREAAAFLRGRNLGPDVRPERAETRFETLWVIAAAPLGDMGEAAVLMTVDGGWLQRCASGCIRLDVCPGHWMNRGESAAFALAVAGHRYQINTICTEREVRGFDWLKATVTVSYVPAGELYRAVCLCGWRSGRSEYRPGVTREAEAHRLQFEPIDTPDTKDA